VVFEKNLAPPREEPLDPRLGPHQVLGAPKIEF
jgi:hypothetical protein